MPFNPDRPRGEHVARGRRPKVVWWRDAICTSGLSPATRHVALTISQFFGSDRLEARPSRTTLSTMSGFSLRTIDAHTKKLEEAGYLEARRTRGGALTPNTYRGLFPPTAQLPPEFSTTTHLDGENGANKTANGAPPAHEEVKKRRKKSGPRPLPISDCWGCKQERPLVDEDILFCEDCFRAVQEAAT